MNIKETKKNIIQAGHKAVEILNRIQEEEAMLEDKPVEEKKENVFKGFAEGRSK